MSQTEEGAEPSAGLYEQVVDRSLKQLLDTVQERFQPQLASLDAGESHSILAQHLGHLLSRALGTFKGPTRVQEQIELCNRIVAVLTAHDAKAVPPSRAIVADAERMLALYPRQPLLGNPVPARPQTPLSVSCLLTGSRVDPSLVSQLRKELLTADRVDILCSFIKWSGVRVLQEEFRALTQHPASQLRIITTSYMGATEPRAVEFLSQLPNTQLRISYDTRRTRLHAKAYLFHRTTGFSTAYVGSSNLSNAALTDGLEWNVKISQYESPHLWEKLSATFASYWDDAEFIHYGEDQRERLRLAIQDERGEYGAGPGFQFDVRPYPFQQEILDRLHADRTLHDRWRNLVVAATGTGKTVIAAFDFQRCKLAWEREHPGRTARLLFVAHREEILKQSLSCFRAVLRDPNFGDLLVGQYRPERLDHLFVSIQSFNSHALAGQIARDHFDFVVVDEFHRGEAPSYAAMLEHVRPRVLLGLTATPERADGRDILHHFDGRISAEIRLAEAINRKLLAPFQYFGLSDTVDLSGVRWRRGGYAVEELDQRLSRDEARADLVVRQVREKLVDPRLARGLGFCVSVKHAEFMAAYFQKCGIPAEALTGDSPVEARRTIQRRLLNREINFIFTVDLYNEGVDLPAVDTVLFLRPTESLTVFLQQLGRGLRLQAEKDCLTVLDFIGLAHRSYNWENRFRALMDRPRKRVDQEIEDGCLHLPLGCFIHLERVAQKHVLENIRRAVMGRATDLVQRIARFAEDAGQPPTLSNFLAFYGWSPEEIYRRSTWSRLCASAGVRPPFADEDEELLRKGLRRIAHVNSPDLIRRLIRLINANDQPQVDTFDERALLTLHVSLWKSWAPQHVGESLVRLRQNGVLRQELLELLAYQYEQISEVAPALGLPFSCPLELHALYTRDEVLAGLGSWTLQRRRELREGVLWVPEIRADVFFLTLNKTETEYSPTTLYEDYAMSADRFHWQSQSTTSESSPTGQRYIHHVEQRSVVLLFVREDRERNGLACPYHFLGPVSYESHTGSRPMNIIWRLEHPLPARLLPTTLRLAVA